MDTGTPKLKLNAQIVEEAAEWLVEFSCGNADLETRRHFDAWLRASPQHIRAYLELLPTWEAGAAARGDGAPSAESLIALARESSNVVPLTAEPVAATAPAALPDRRQGFAGYRAAAAIAAAILGLLAAATGMRHEWSRYPTYATAAGEQRSIVLPDGSTVELDSLARISVRYSAHERDVDLITGQALFEDTENAQRPFVVFSGSVRVRAIGTQFNVSRDTDSTTVTVVKGRVAVLRRDGSPALMPQPVPQAPSLLLLSAGEQATVTANAMTMPRHVDITLATAWLQRHLLFNSTPLPQVVRQFNRYNTRKLVVDDAGLNDFLVSGVFTSTNPDSLLRFLRAQPGMHVQDEGDKVLISRR